MKLLKIFVLSLIVFVSCKNSNDPNIDAFITSFSILEIPTAEFQIDNSTGIISILNRNQADIPEDITSLTAVFETSSGANVFVDDQVQISGETQNSFEGGIFYKLVSEEGEFETKYFVHLEENLPAKYFYENSFEIISNPSGKAPLSALLTLNTNAAVSISFEIKGDIPISKTFGSSKEHQIEIHGLYPDTNNEIELSFETEEGIIASHSVFIQTDPVPEFFPEINIDVHDETRMEPGMHFSEMHIGNAGTFNSYPVIFDNNGDIRWYVDLSDIGAIVWPVHFNDDMTFYSTSGAQIHEFNMFGEELINLKIDGNYMHHELIKLPNGNYLAATTQQGYFFIDDEGIERESVEDLIIEVDKNSGEILNEWDLAEVLDVDRVSFFDPNSGDWFHMNAIFYQESDSSLIISGRNQGLVKVNYENELQWVLAPHKGWGNAGRNGDGFDINPYLLTAVDENGTAYSDDVQSGETYINDFNWVWGQHAPMILPNGNLFVFDNGFRRNFYNAGNFSLATEYRIDENNLTVEQIWSYGKQRGVETHSIIISDVDYLPITGNRLFAPGNIDIGNGQSKIVEVTYPGGEVVFESTFTYKKQLSTGTGFGNSDISYRAERIELYR